LSNTLLQMSESATVPTVSIGLPVYNGENYVQEAIDSILGQSYSDFELIICDNASTDKTAEICEQAAEKDSRVRYVRNEKNMGATWNFNRTFELSQGEYFRWAGHDDRIDPTFIEKCLAALQEREKDGYVCCWPNTEVIDGEGNISRKYIEPELRLESDVVSERFHDGTYVMHSSFQFHGIIRSDVLARTCKLGQWISSDYTMIGQLGLLGKIYQHPEYLFKRREHINNGYHSCQQDYYQYAKFWVAIEKKDSVLFPYWRMAYEAAKGVFKAPIPVSERLKCLWYVVTCRNRHRGRSQYLWDLLYGMREYARKLFSSEAKS